MADDYSAEELERERRRRLIDEARATVERLKDIEKRRAKKSNRCRRREVARRLLPACADDAVARWARDADERERERRAAERELRREARRDRLIRKRYEGAQPAAATRAGDDWNAWCDARIDARLEEERTMVMDIVGECLGELLAKERDATMAALRDQVRELKVEIAELRSDHARARSSVVDLPRAAASRKLNSKRIAVLFAVGHRDLVAGDQRTNHSHVAGTLPVVALDPPRTSARRSSSELDRLGSSP